jgi:hypothetical protein
LGYFVPSEFALSLYVQWVAGDGNTEEGVVLLKQHHQELEVRADSSNGKAPSNMLGITDSARMKQVAADITILLMA